MQLLLSLRAHMLVNQYFRCKYQCYKKYFCQFFSCYLIMNTCTLDADHLKGCVREARARKQGWTQPAPGGGVQSGLGYTLGPYCHAPRCMCSCQLAPPAVMILANLQLMCGRQESTNPLYFAVCMEPWTLASKFEAGKSGTRKLHCILFSFLLAVFPILMIV